MYGVALRVFFLFGQVCAAVAVEIFVEGQGLFAAPAFVPLSPGFFFRLERPGFFGSDAGFAVGAEGLFDACDTLKAAAFALVNRGFGVF